MNPLAGRPPHHSAHNAFLHDENSAIFASPSTSMYGRSPPPHQQDLYDENYDSPQSGASAAAGGRGGGNNSRAQKPGSYSQQQQQQPQQRRPPLQQQQQSEGGMKVKASSVFSSPNGNNIPTTAAASLPAEQAPQSATMPFSPLSSANPAFYLNDPLRRFKTFYAFVACILPTFCAVSLSIGIVAPDWFRSQDFKYKKDGDYLAKYFEVPDKSYAGIAPFSPNITCIPMYAPSAVAVAQAEYLNFLSSYSTVNAGTTALTNSDAGAGDATAAARAIVAVSPFGCRDLGDAVTGVSWLLIALVIVLLLNVSISVYELASRGPYGGDRSTARVSFICALIAFAVTLIISIGWYLVANMHFCSKLSLSERGFRFGWPYAIHTTLLLVLLADCVYSGRAISRISRGPPSMLIIFRTVQACWAGVGIFAQGYLRHAAIDSLTITGWAEACLEFTVEYPCPSMNLYTKLLLGAILASILVSCIAVFFVAARAVDQKGKTLLPVIIVGILMCLISLAMGVALFAIFSVDGAVCKNAGYPSVWNSGFRVGSGAWCIVPVCIFSFIFVVMNILYQTKCTEKEQIIDLWKVFGNGGLAPPNQSQMNKLLSGGNTNNNNNNNKGDERGRKNGDDDDVDDEVLNHLVRTSSDRIDKSLSPQEEARRAALSRNDTFYGNMKMNSGGTAKFDATVRAGNSTNSGSSAVLSDKLKTSKARAAALAQRFIKRRKSMYHWFWFDGLTDSRTASILQREYGDAMEEGNEDELENDEGENQDDVAAKNKNDEEMKNILTKKNSLGVDQAGVMNEQRRSPKMEGLMQ